MNKSIKITILLFMGLLLVAYTVFAETKYVSDSLVITLRTGPAGDRKIIAQPRVGTPLEVIKSGKDYSEVKTPSGKQGWVLTRYLTSNKPDRMLLAQLQAEHAIVVAKYDALKKKADTLDTTSKGLSGDLANTQKKMATLTAEHETLIKESKGFLQLKAKYEKAVKEASEMRAKAEKADKAYQQVNSSQLTTGILIGGGLMIFGFIVGFIVKRPRRRSALM